MSNSVKKPTETSNSVKKTINMVQNNIFDIVLEDLMYSYKQDYTKSDYSKLYEEIQKLVEKNKIIKFFLPAFPAKSQNTEEKVLGPDADFAEFLAIDTFLKAARKIEAIYEPGVVIIVMSDYHTFDQFVGISNEKYMMYFEGLKTMIHNKGADDVIQLINLSYFREFKFLQQEEISTTLAKYFGGEDFSQEFEESISKNPDLLKRYMQKKKFMQIDQSNTLRLSPRSQRKVTIKKISRGMLSQGVALDNFLKQQTDIKHYIRLSIHNRNPNDGKFTVDLYKHQSVCTKQLRTPWHNVVVFDTLSSEFDIDHKKVLVERNRIENSKLALVYFQQKPWFYIQLYFSCETPKDVEFQISLTKESCGMIVEAIYKDGNKQPKIKTDIFKSEVVKSLINQFGVIVFRGFHQYENDEDLLEYYNKLVDSRILEWDFGAVHKVYPTDDMPGIVNSNDGLPFHWDMAAPPKYMGVEQHIHKYEDFTCPMFVLYCHRTSGSSQITTGNINAETSTGEVDVTLNVEKMNIINANKINNEGATTFIDAKAVVLALNGKKIEEWRNTELIYETTLKEKATKEVYFGGKGNIYRYPLIHTPPKTNFQVLRWWQTWTEEEHPNSKQHNWYKVSSESVKSSPVEMENEIRKVALDERFNFAHVYEEGDQVHVNNYTTLHGRNSFSAESDRELWRIQALPKTDNLPKYFIQSKIN